LSEQDSFGLAGTVNLAEVVVERRGRIDAEVIVEHVVNIQQAAATKNQRAGEDDQAQVERFDETRNEREY
jgi:hypothetical protein